jgi:hypothetical protein
VTQDPDRAWFSPQLNRIAEVAGDRAALVLGREKACQLIYIPRKPRAGGWLAKLIGMDAATKLAADFGGSQILIPPALIGEKRKRGAAIAQLTDKGYSINQTAQATGVARSTVIEHRARRRGRDDDGNQGSLF